MYPFGNRESGWVARLPCLADRCRKEMVTRKGWQTRQSVDRGDSPLNFHCCTLHTQACLCAYHPSDVRNSHAGSPPSPCDAVQAVVAMKVRLRVARRCSHSVHPRRDAEQAGRDVTRFLWADMRRLRTCVLEALLVSPPLPRHRNATRHCA